MHELLEDAFELSFEEGDCPITGESGEELWELMRTSAGPMKARAETLEPERLESLHVEFVELLEAHRTNGGIHLPGPYLLVLGTRR